MKFLFDTARRAIALDETDSDARTLLVRAYHVARQPEAALAEARRAIELNPNNAFACNVLGVTLSLVMARHEEGIPWIKRALELDPLDPQKHSYLSHLAFAQLCSGQYETAVESADEAIREAPEFFEARVAQASAYGYLGRPEDAQKIIEGFDQAPQSFVAHEPRWGDDTKAYVLAGLRKAGFET